MNTNNSQKKLINLFSFTQRTRNKKLKNLWIITIMLNSVFLMAAFSVKAVDVIITDSTEDVCSIDNLTGETKVVLNHPDINVNNLDLIQANYTKQELHAIVSFQVKGNIENRGELIDPYDDDFFTDFDTVEYELLLTTSEQDYSISYSNNSGMLSYGAEQVNLTSSDFSVVGNTLTISFNLTSANETYSDLSVSSTYIKFVYDEEEPFIELLSDVAPNPPLAVYEAYAPNIGSIGESVQFNARIEPLTGTPPYTYHWDFGDASSSTQLNPTHIYRYARIFTYTFTVTDRAGATTNKSGNITIEDNYQLIRVFLFGRFKNITGEGWYVTIKAVNLWIFFFEPFQSLHFIAGQKIMFQNHYDGIIIGNDFLIGGFNIVIPFNRRYSLKP